MEDGEIEDESDDIGYVPISRPEVSPPMIEPQHQPINVYSDDSSEDDSDSESSDSRTFPTKRPKVKLKTCQTVAPVSIQKKKYDIWSEPLQEEVLTESLGNFGVDLESNKMDRNVENYNYKLGFMYKQNHTRDESPSRISDGIDDDYIERKFNNERLGNKRKSVKERLGKKKSNKLIDGLQKLTVTASDPPDDVASNIAKNLMEEKQFLIYRVVEEFGTERAIELYNKTRSIEADGGMMIMDQSRRRTPGGVYLKLVSIDDQADRESVKKIFGGDHRAENIKRKKLIARKRRNKTQAVKQELITNGLLNNDLSDLLIKTDIKEEDIKPDMADDNHLLIQTEIHKEISDEQTLTNPPPSPATDQDTPPPPSREQEFITYSDEENGDYLEIETEMELL